MPACRIVSGSLRFLLVWRRAVTLFEKPVEIGDAFDSYFIADRPDGVVRCRQKISGIIDFQFVDLLGKGNAVVILEFFAHVRPVISELIVNFVYGVEMGETGCEEYIAFGHEFVSGSVVFFAGNDHAAEQCDYHAVVVFPHPFDVLRHDVCRGAFLEIFHIAFGKFILNEMFFFQFSDNSWVNQIATLFKYVGRDHVIPMNTALPGDPSEAVRTCRGDDHGVSRFQQVFFAVDFMKDAAFVDEKTFVKIMRMKVFVVCGSQFGIKRQSR